MTERKWEPDDVVAEKEIKQLSYPEYDDAGNESGNIGLEWTDCDGPKIDVEFKDLLPEVQSALQSEEKMRKVAKEMDEICYAVLDCFTPTTKEQEKWLSERKAEYAEAHPKIVLGNTEEEL